MLEYAIRLMQLAIKESPNADAIFILAGFYHSGLNGFPRNDRGALKLYHQAADLRHAEALAMLGRLYFNGRLIAKDTKKARSYLVRASVEGSLNGRHYLGSIDLKAGNHERAYKHFIIAARAGHEPSLRKLTDACINNTGFVTKDEWREAMQSYQKKHQEAATDARDRANENRTHIMLI